MLRRTHNSSHHDLRLKSFANADSSLIAAEEEEDGWVRQNGGAETSGQPGVKSDMQRLKDEQYLASIHTATQRKQQVS